MSQATLDTVGGEDLNPSAFSSLPPPGLFKLRTARRAAQYAEVADRAAQYTGQTIQPDTKLIGHEIATSGSGYDANLEELKKLYDTKLGEQTLVFTDTDSVAKRGRVVLQRLLQHASGVRQILAHGEWLILSRVWLKNAAESVAAAAKTSTPATVSVANSGNVATPEAQYTFQPTVQKTAANGQLYLVYCNAVNRAPRAVSGRRNPIEVTDGGWDHAALVTASKSAADGDDVEVYVNGGRVMRWDGAGTAAFNNSGTRIWCNVDFPAARYWLDTTGSGVTAVATTLQTMPGLRMPAMPFYAMFVDAVRGNEVVKVTAYNEDSGEMTMVRGKRGTSGAIHATGIKLYHMPVLIDLVYGYTSAAAPDYIDDDFKPLPAENQGSGNDAWTYTYYQETEEQHNTQRRKPRSGGWHSALRPNPDWTGRDNMYTKWLPFTATLTTDAALATAIAISYNDDGATPGHPLIDRWELVSDIGMQQIVADIDSSNLNHPVVGAGNNEGKVRVLAECVDGSISAVYTDATVNDAGRALSTAIPALVYAFAIYPFDPDDPQDNTAANVVAQKPSDGDGVLVDTVTITFDTDESFELEVSSEQNCYQMGRPDAPATWENVDGEELEINGLVLKLSDTLTITMTETGVTVTDGEGISWAHILSGTYPEIPDGTNNLTYTEAGLAGGASISIGVPSYRSAWN